MTQRDKWKKRPAVLKYHAFKDECRLNKLKIPESGATVTFIIPMSASWSKKKKNEMEGKPHQQRPDVDNYLKAVLDAIYGEDCTVWDIRVRKIWGVQGGIIVDSSH